MRRIMNSFVTHLRAAAPYLRRHRGRTFVVVIRGAAVLAPDFPQLARDIALLHTLGTRIVLVHGARPQINARLLDSDPAFAGGLRVTDAAMLKEVIATNGVVRTEIEARLSLGLTTLPAREARVDVASGNFVTARPRGVRDGVDFQHTGEVRRIDTQAIQRRLDDGAMVLLSPLGYSPSGEVFNLRAPEVAAETAIALKADKLLFLSERPLPACGEITLQAAQQIQHPLLQHAVRAVQAGVPRAHLIQNHQDGALLGELYTRDGNGLLLSSNGYDHQRVAKPDDVPGILDLIAPLEAEGNLAPRSREQLELIIDHFRVFERDGLIAACGALHPYVAEKMGELACLVVHEDYRCAGRAGDILLALEQAAKAQGLTQLFILTTQAAHWFIEHGFVPATLDALPADRQASYSANRQSKIFVKPL